MMEKSLFSLFSPNDLSIRRILILLAVFFLGFLKAEESWSDQIVISGGAEIITVTNTDQTAVAPSEITIKKREKPHILKSKRKMVAREAEPEKKIKAPASVESVQNFPVEKSHSFITMMTSKASGATSSQDSVALLPLNKILLHGTSLLYNRINAALIGAIAFKFSRRYTCRPPPVLA